MTSLRFARVFSCSILALLPLNALLAGPYSPGNGASGYVDSGIPGFVNGVVNPIFVGWATGYVSYSPSDPTSSSDSSVVIPAAGNTTYIGTSFSNPAKALGPVVSGSFDIVSLGDMSAAEITAYKAEPTNAVVKPGELVLTFAHAITNGAGADFATFENGFISGGKLFAELGYVEVSTDGVNFARFPNASLTPAAVGAYGTVDPSNVWNLVGKHANSGTAASWGTPFDLGDLVDHPLVTNGIVNLAEINFVKIVDIPGNGAFTDSAGNPIYDAWQTWGSGGVDFEALGVINAVPEPSTYALIGGGLCGLAVLVKRRRRTTAAS